MPDGPSVSWRRLGLPWIDTRIDEYTIEAWKVQPGDRVDIGDVLCVVRSGALSTHSPRQGNQSHIGWLERRRLKRSTAQPIHIKFRARVIAGEPGYVGALVTPVGAIVRRSAPIALMTAEPPTGTAPNIAQLLEFRSEAEMIGRDDPEEAR